MELSQEHIDFELNLKRMVGIALNKVEYLEINYDPEKPKPYFKTRFNEIDTVDFSIIFQTDKGKIEVCWDGQFYQFGIGVRFNQETEIATGQNWDVSHSNLWGKFIGYKVSDVRLTWEEVIIVEERTGKSEKFIYPQDLRIDFMNDKSIFISAAEFLHEDDHEVMGTLDNLTVTDNELLARKVNMIR